MKCKIVSFSWKKGGPPPETACVIDCRPMRNPHSIASLRPLTGLDAPVQDYVAGDPSSEARLEQALRMVEQGVTVAFGCYGGQHRSVAMAELLAQTLRDAKHDVEVRHLALATHASSQVACKAAYEETCN